MCLLQSNKCAHCVLSHYTFYSDVHGFLPLAYDHYLPSFPTLLATQRPSRPVDPTLPMILLAIGVFFLPSAAYLALHLPIVGFGSLPLTMLINALFAMHPL